MNLKDLYFLTAIGLIHLGRGIPVPRFRSFLVGALAFVACHLSRSKARVTNDHIARTFGDSLDVETRRRIARSSFREFWREMLSWLPTPRDMATLRQAEVRGLEHLRAALAEGRGAILWENTGFGRRSFAKRLLHEKGFHIHQVHGAGDLGGFRQDGTPTWVRRHLVKRFFENRERQFLDEIIHLPRSSSLGFVRLLQERLRQNAIVCITADGTTGQRFVPLPFLGGTVFFPTGMVSLARISRAPILPMFCFREDSGERLVIETPIVIEDDDRERGTREAVARYARLLESYVRRYPEQYRNWHVLGSFEPVAEPRGNGA
jgi:lauroyl/myristoyl acyltransferase